MERSENLKDWVEVPITPDLLTFNGKILQPYQSGSSYYRLSIPVGREPDFVLIPAGSFLMGSPQDEPGRALDTSSTSNEIQHPVTLTRSFYMQQTETTWAQWQRVREWALLNGYTDMPVGLMGYPTNNSGLNSIQEAVTFVSFSQIVRWLNAKSEREGLVPAFRVNGEVARTGTAVVVCDFDATGYRLPTEAEWEYAARAGTNTAFSSGPISHTGVTPLDPNLDKIAWYGGNALTYQADTNFQKGSAAGQKEMNAFGLYDMSGNYFEWVWDSRARTYTSDPVIDPVGTASSSSNLFFRARGGYFGSEARFCRSAYRGFGITSYNDRFQTVSFRPVRTALK